MQFIVLIEENNTGPYSATWISKQGHFTDHTRAIGKNPYIALKNLAMELEAREERQAIINAIDYEDD